MIMFSAQLIAFTKMKDQKRTTTHTYTFIDI